MDRVQKWYEDFKKRLEGYSDLEFIAAFNGQVRNPGTGSARMAYLSAIRQEFYDRKIDISALGTDGSA